MVFQSVCLPSIKGCYGYKIDITGVYCGLSESKFYVFYKLCPVGFLVVCECS